LKILLGGAPDDAEGIASDFFHEIDQEQTRYVIVHLHRLLMP
jgi:hypothetical protein